MYWLAYIEWMSSVDVVVKLLACGAICPEFDSCDLAAMISKTGYLLLPTRDITEISTNQHWVEYEYTT